MSEKFRHRILIGCTALITGFVIWSAQAKVPGTLIAQGDQQWAAGQLELAQKTFEQAVKAEPQSVSAYMKLAGLQLSRQEFKACIDTYQRTIGLDANNAKPGWVWVSRIFIRARMICR